MKRKIISLLLVLILVGSMAIAVSAASSRILAIDPGLSFDGTTAQCSLIVCSDYLTDSISATIKLYRGTTCIKTWVRSSTGYLSFYEEVTAIKNREYTLEAVVTINGITKSPLTVTNTCE